MPPCPAEHSYHLHHCTSIQHASSNFQNTLAKQLLIVLLQVLSFAVKPRALWVAAHHLQLSGRMDGLWSALLNAVADLVSGNEAEYDFRR